jgi:predicted hotdog family 3-hydroxylacyl-ACP dehydratase
MTAPQTLARDGIAARIPHRGDMCLLDRLERWDAQHLHASTARHADAANPLRTASGLMSANAIEFAAQAMALHGGLLVAEGTQP